MVDYSADESRKCYPALKFEILMPVISPSEKYISMDFTPRNLFPNFSNFEWLFQN
jgi:hypothetical protein